MDPAMPILFLGQDASRIGMPVATELRSAFSLRPFDSATHFSRQTAEDHVGVVVMTGDGLPGLANLKGPLPRVVLVAGRGTAEEARSAGPPFYAILSRSQLHASLLRVVTRALTEGMFEELSEAISVSNSYRGREELRKGLLRALRIDQRPVNSVKAMARHVGVSVRLLEQRWAGRRSQAKLNLKGLLSTVLVMRAMLSRLSDHRPSWAAVAREFGVNPKTLRAAVFSVVAIQPSSVDLPHIPELLRKVNQMIHATTS